VAGEFVFRRQVHDEGSKSFLGKTGNFDGDDVLNILLEHQQTANYICRKLYRYFVNDTPDDAHVQWMSSRFYQSNYDITGLMNDIFSATWFYDEKNIGSKIKSPIELIVGNRRALPMKIENEEAQLILERLLGQVLFYPPNVAGWPGGKNWIDSSSLMLRMRIPQMIYAADELSMRPKDDDDQMMGMADRPALAKRGGQVIRTTIDWDSFLGKFEKVPREGLLAEIAGTLLQVPDKIDPSVMNKYTDGGSRENYIKTATIQLMSTPEYQLC